MNEKIARTIAHIQADGCVRHRKDDGRFEIQYYNTSDFLIDEFREMIKMIFKKEAWKPVKRKTATMTGTGDKKIVSELMKYPLKNWRIPNEILKGLPKCRKAYLRAFFDDEGSVTQPRKIKLYSKNAFGIKQIRKMLLEFGIESNIYKPTKRNVFELDIGNKKSIFNFAKNIGFNHPQKREKLKIIVNDMIPLQ
jgi:DNA-binding transcriptional regulator WhiA